MRSACAEGRTDRPVQGVICKRTRRGWSITPPAPHAHPCHENASTDKQGHYRQTRHQVARVGPGAWRGAARHPRVAGALCLSAPFSKPRPPPGCAETALPSQHCLMTRCSIFTLFQLHQKRASYLCHLANASGQCVRACLPTAAARALRAHLRRQRRAGGQAMMQAGLEGEACAAGVCAAGPADATPARHWPVAAALRRSGGEPLRAGSAGTCVGRACGLLACVSNMRASSKRASSTGRCSRFTCLGTVFTDGGSNCAPARGCSRHMRGRQCVADTRAPA